jgi:hypothetical protein
MIAAKIEQLNPLDNGFGLMHAGRSTHAVIIEMGE